MADIAKTCKNNIFFMFFQLLLLCIIVSLDSLFDLFLIDLFNKNHSKIDQKTIEKRSKNQSKNGYDFGSILEPTWLRFERI